MQADFPGFRVGYWSFEKSLKKALVLRLRHFFRGGHSACVLGCEGAFVDAASSRNKKCYNTANWSFSTRRSDSQPMVVLVAVFHEERTRVFPELAPAGYGGNT